MKVEFFACPNCSRVYDGEDTKGLMSYCQNKKCHAYILRKITLYLPRLSYIDGYGFQDIKLKIGSRKHLRKV